LLQPATVTGAEEPVVADLDEALGQHVLKKAPQELLG
jgi:hypothetical protein